MFRKSRFAFATFLIMIANFCVSIPFALAVDEPVLDEIISPINAPKAFIRGTTEPGFKIIVIGGSFDIPPITADANGRFEIQVALIQESENLYSIKAEDPETGEFSEQIDILIIEGAEAAAQAETTTGGDYTAPESPVLNQQNQTINAGSFKFTGTGEPNATLMIDGSQKRTLKIKADGTFSVSLSLKQNQINTFDFNIKDSAGNLGASVRVIITEESPDEGMGEEILDETPENHITLNDILSHWARSYIEELIERGVVRGYEDGTFRPDASVTRAEFLKMALGALDYEISESINEKPFSDVEISSWYAPYVKVAKQAGITSGYEDGTFKPDKQIQRSEALKMLFIAAEIEVTAEGESEFPDVCEQEWFFPYVKKAHELGIVSGYANGNFGPADPMTRGQVAKVIMELLNQF